MCRVNKVGPLYYGKMEQELYLFWAYVLVLSVIVFGKWHRCFLVYLVRERSAVLLLIWCCRVQGPYVVSLLLAWNMAAIDQASHTTEKG